MTKRQRVEGKPTRPVSGFIRFMNERRIKYTQEVQSNAPANEPAANGSIVTQVSSLAKRDWDLMSKEDRKEWNGPASEEITIYNEAVKEFKKNNPTISAASETAKKQKKVRLPGTPKKTATSYILFSVAERLNSVAELTCKGEEANFANIAKTTATRWKNMTDEEKKPWMDKASALAKEAKEAAEKEKIEMELMRASTPEQVEGTASPTEPMQVEETSSSASKAKQKRKYNKKNTATDSSDAAAVPEPPNTPNDTDPSPPDTTNDTDDAAPPPKKRRTTTKKAAKTAAEEPATPVA